jgi:cytochrome b5
VYKQEGDPTPKTGKTNLISAGPDDTSSTTSLGIGLYAAILVGGAIAFGAYKYMQANEGK